MAIEISKINAKIIRRQLMNSAVAPGQYAHFINAGTGKILSVFESEYFKEELPEGLSCFKYLEGDYGSGKTQFINSLAERARTNNIVTSLVNIGQECPFNSQASIYRAIMASFLPPSHDEKNVSDAKGIEILIHSWITSKLHELGWTTGQEVSDMARQQVEKSFTQNWLGAPDTQMAFALRGLGKRLLAQVCDAQDSILDSELISWVRGDKVRSANLKNEYSLHEPVRDETAFTRLKTVFEFLRTRLGYKGFFVAFDEGTRTNTFRRGSVKQKQAIENMLTMINEHGDGQFRGVMFMYAADPTFRSDVIQNYPALFDRIGSVAFVPGHPLTPLIILESLNTDEVISEIGENLLAIFAKADAIEWDKEIQYRNIQAIIKAIYNIKFYDAIPPRQFVYPYCRFLDIQKFDQKEISIEDAEEFIQSHTITESEDEE